MKCLSKTSLAVGMAMALSAGASQAATVTSLLFSDTLFEDDSQSSARNPDGTRLNGSMDVGDRLRGIFDMPRLVDNEPTGDSVNLIAPHHELTGIYDVTIAAKCAPGTLTLGCAPYVGGPLADFAFAPTPGFAAEIAAITGMVVSGGTMVALFTDPSHDYAQGGATCTTDAIGGDCEGHVTDGTLFYTAGLSGLDADEVMFAQFLPENPFAFGGANGTSSQLGSFNYALAVLDNYIGKDIEQRPCFAVCGLGGDGLVDIVGTGTAGGTLGAGGMSVTPYQVTDDTDFSISFVPEPGTMALLGAGLLGAGFASRRRHAA